MSAQRPPPTIDELRALLRDHGADLHRHKVRALSVFGSVARGEAGAGSDVDVLVEFDESRNPTLFDIIGLKHHLQDILGRPVDVAELKGLRDRMRWTAEKDAVQIY